jgi:hypothetical protein
MLTQIKPESRSDSSAVSFPFLDNHALQTWIYEMLVRERAVSRVPLRLVSRGQARGHGAAGFTERNGPRRKRISPEM